MVIKYVHHGQGFVGLALVSVSGSVMPVLALACAIVCRVT
jgi:hypothetical protein